MISDFEHILISARELCDKPYRRPDPLRRDLQRLGRDAFVNYAPKRTRRGVYGTLFNQLVLYSNACGSARAMMASGVMMMINRPEFAKPLRRPVNIEALSKSRQSEAPPPPRRKNIRLPYVD